MALADVTDSNFKSQVLDADRPVVVDFWAPWCAPCRMINPMVESLAQEYGDRIKFLKMDVDENPQTPGQFGILSLPTVIIFKGGRQADRLVGASAGRRADLREKIEA